MATGRQDTGLTPDAFFADIVGGLAGGLEENIGLKGSAAFIGEVGTEIGDDLFDKFDAARKDGDWTPQEIGEVLCELKARIGGQFEVEHASDGEIVLTATRCPFAHRVRGRPSLCMMTTTVFGTIVSRASGYADVVIDEALARGDAGCRVTVKLRREGTPNGFEFFR
ncbi:methanogen output domain 1-containing protein [Roseicyclus sp. F158]|uniref:Methanogen output domain 1-containing protein n=1 Tax=Tropicimonas omnivorans TaxID=3075590 RepID=A0ABU3DH68_9RHOB|nr:methanogen output domain 1-containing protein [Roseicyclus sp. F158]MDT0682903.1 methanogen output domain 1-containing protein [Roseicyclus sp. F158]